MDNKRDNKKFWDRYATLYDFEINMSSRKAYTEMYRLMSKPLSLDMKVLEVATGTGLISINIAPYVREVEATDFSPKMIEAAKRKKAPGNIRFSVEDATSLSFNDNTFDAVIISNALHIMPDPVLTLSSISRVLKMGGLLIAPNFTHGHLSDSTWNLNAKFLKFIGFETYSKWKPEEYVGFIGKNDFRVDNWRVLRAAFPLVYLEAHKI